MYKPVLSLDVSKENSIAALYLSFGEPMGKPFRVEHTPSGFAALVEQLRNLELLTHKKPEVILESTGNYSRAITQNLMEAGYSVIALNPLETHEQKRRAIRKVKTDKVDAQRIAKLYYFDEHRPLHPVNPEIAELRNLCRLYDGLSNLYIEAQLRFQSILDLLFPHYTNVFSDLCGDSSLNLISVFPTPEAVLSACKEDIVKHLKSKCQRKDWPEQIYQKLLAAARACLPYKVAQQSNVRVLREYIPILMTQKRLLSGLRAQIVAAAKGIPAYSLLKTIPGVGEITAASILAEIGNITLFPTAKQLVAFAGLDPSVCQSGRFKADKNKLSKRGSGYLRKALYQAASAGVRVTGKGPVILCCMITIPAK
ncbi:IS110 family RNA-guided transposase [Thermincola ferriacetica]